MLVYYGSIRVYVLEAEAMERVRDVTTQYPTVIVKFGDRAVMLE